MNIVLLGPPGSGKGTQGQLLAQTFGLVQLSTGDLFRQILQDPSHPLYDSLQVIKEGKLVSDEIVNAVVEDALIKLKDAKGVIFDGFPRTVAQAEALDRMLNSMGKKVEVVLDFDVTKDVLLHRLLGRRVCSSCKRVFHIKQGYTECPECQGQLTIREDDNEEVIIKRFGEYNQKSAGVKEYYLNADCAYIRLFVNDPDISAEEVNKWIIQELSKRGLVQ
ncbi:MAG: nucleoside monophosphate kinase [Clostridia bacterium]|nr:adenylate kinase [Clostridia bacterium]